MSLKLIGIIACVIGFCWIAFNQGLFDQELERLDAMPISAPNLSPEMEGNALFLQGRYEEAMAKYQKALRSDDPQTRMESQYRIARCWEELGQASKARAAYQAYVNRYPSDNRAQKAREKVELLQ